MRTCVCTITDNNFVIGVVTMLYSFFETNKWYDGDVIIFYSDIICPLSFFNRNKIEKQFINKNIKFKKVDESKYESIMKLKLVRTVPSIFTFEAFELDYDRVVYLDADMIVINDVKHLFDISYDLGVTIDEWKTYNKTPSLSKLYHKTGYEEFNGGLFSIGKALLNKGIRDKLIEHTKTQKSWKLWDQTILNSYFHENLNQIYYFGSDFNSLKRCFDNSHINRYKKFRPNIIHYVGKKPWSGDSKERSQGRIFNYSNINDIWKKWNTQINNDNIYNQVDNDSMFLNKKGIDLEYKEIKEYLKNPLQAGYMKVDSLIDFSNDYSVYELLQQFLPEKIKIPFNEKQTFAVIGNGDCISNKKMGRNIDSHNSVIRINDFSVDSKFVDDVGKKTSILLLNEYCIICIINNGYNGDAKYIVLVNPREENYGMLLLFYCYLHFTNDINKDKFLLLSPSYRRKICTILNYQFPSSGYFAVSIARDISLKHVSLYGFNVDTNSPLYYQKSARLNYSLHKIKNEYLLYKKWASNNFIIYAGKKSISKPIVVPRSKPIIRPKPKIIIPQTITKQKPKPKSKQVSKPIPKIEEIIESKKYLQAKQKPRPKSIPTPLSLEKIIREPVITINAPKIRDTYKYAIYIYGTPHNIGQNIRFLKLFLNNNNIDLFIHLNIKNLNNDIHILQKELEPKSYLFEIHNKDFSNITKDWSTTLETISNISDMYSLYKCNQLKTTYEQEKDISYQYIIALNFNMTYNDIINNLINPIVPKIDKYYNNIYVPNSYNGYGMNTNLAICHSKIMNVYANFYKWIENAKNKYPLNVEYLMCKYIILNGIKINIIKFDYFYLQNKKFYTSEHNLQTIRNDLKNNWEEMGDIDNIEYNTTYVNEYYKIKMESISNII